jgi:hypothetical protein
VVLSRFQLLPQLCSLPRELGEADCLERPRSFEAAVLRCGVLHVTPSTRTLRAVRTLRAAFPVLRRVPCSFQLGFGLISRRISCVVHGLQRLSGLGLGSRRVLLTAFSSGLAPTGM